MDLRIIENFTPKLLAQTEALEKNIFKDSYRQGHLSREILDKVEHQVAKEKGYKVIRTHTMNKFREMLLFNIKVGFQITGTYQKLGYKDLSIVLEKKL